MGLRRSNPNPNPVSIPTPPIYDVGRVGSITELLYRIQLKEFEEHYTKLDSDTIWISALVLCPRKWLYMRMFKELVQANFRGHFILGKAVHLGLQQLLYVYASNLGFRKIEVEKEVEKRINVDLDGLPRIVRLSGRIDALAVDEDDNRVVIEIKTARADLGLPHQHHVEQLRIYMNMASASRGILLYITPDRIAEYVIDKPMDDHELQELVTKFLKFEGPRYDWECSNCPFSSLCPYKRCSNQLKR